MRFLRKPSPPAPRDTPAAKNTPKPASLAGTSSPAPRTRVFFVLDSIPDEPPAPRPPASAEETYRDALEDAVDSLLREVQATSSAVRRDPLDQPIAGPLGPVAEALSEKAVPPPEQPAPPTPTPSAPITNDLPGTDPRTHSQPPAKHKKRKKPDSTSTTKPPEDREARRSSQRLRVRRELLWDDDTTQGGDGS